MHTVSTFRHWMHIAHDEGIKAARRSPRMLHEKTFWEIVAILVALTRLFGEGGGDYQPMPTHYGVYHF